MDLYSDEIIRQINKRIIHKVRGSDYEDAINGIGFMIAEIHDSIPDKKRISYGIHYVVKSLGQKIHEILCQRKYPVQEFSEKVYDLSYREQTRESSVALQIMACSAMEDRTRFPYIVPYFEKSAASPDWEMREHCAGFFRKLIKRYPDKAKGILESFSLSKDDRVRRFASETLRPVADGRWLQKRPDYSINIVRRMFREEKTYPRTSVGNNLSDLSRNNGELIFGIVKELVDMNDKNSYWIAFRACRNLVKKEPLRVMDLLNVEEYRYKDRHFRIHE